jgi:hypothetical protein
MPTSNLQLMALFMKQPAQSWSKNVAPRSLFNDHALVLIVRKQTGRELNGCDTGDSKITKGYNLPSKHVIHTVGPIYSSPDVDVKAEQLASCYKRSLEVAAENSLKSIVSYLNQCSQS